jgi:hypothetical protein
MAADDAFSVAMKLTFSPAGSGILVKADISFVPERVKDSAKRTVEKGPQQDPGPVVDVAEDDGDPVVDVTAEDGDLVVE